jgi:hypothetical protein
VCYSRMLTDMNVDVYDNRSSTKVIRGDILEMQILPDDGSGKQFPHLCITLNTGFNVLVELDTLKQINRFMEEQA